MALYPTGLTVYIFLIMSMCKGRIGAYRTDLENKIRKRRSARRKKCRRRSLTINWQPENIILLHLS
jgi:hypothetical protein